ncbi:MAG: TlpA family protein disulfide reductase [Rubrivivax sp.]|nr:TlpA family protein disulfide reductase [Rubrivivax sp.]
MSHTIRDDSIQQHARRVLLTSLGAAALFGSLAVARRARAAVAPSMPAPDFTLKSAEGGNLRLAELRGRVVLVNFWATWCGPCKIEMPHLNRIYEKYKSAGFVLLGVNIDEDPRQAAALATRMGLKFPVLFDTDKAVSRRYALDSMPGTVLIDRDGKVRHVHKGYREGVEATYDAQVRALVKE